MDEQRHIYKKFADIQHHKIATNCDCKRLFFCNFPAALPPRVVLFEIFPTEISFGKVQPKPYHLATVYRYDLTSIVDLSDIK